MKSRVLNFFQVASMLMLLVAVAMAGGHRYHALRHSRSRGAGAALNGMTVPKHAAKPRGWG